MDPNDWALSGNLNTDPNTNFLGTTDGKPLVIQPTGNVGVGTRSPNAKLEVDGSGPPLVIIGNSGASGNTEILNVHSGSAGQDVAIRLDGSDNVNQGYIHYSAGGQYLALSVGSRSAADNLVVTSDGNVGVGTPSPNAKLEVHGDRILAQSSNLIGLHAVGGGATFTPAAAIAAIYAEGGPNAGILIFNSSDLAGALEAYNRGGPNNTGPGLIASSSGQGTGISGGSEQGNGVSGNTGGTLTTAGVFGSASAPGSNGVIGEANNEVTAFGVWGRSNSGFAGKFSGNVSIGSSFDGTKLGDLSVTGTLTKGFGGFKIDHPLDPENKYLVHSFVESPDMLNIYNGNVTTDANGDAAVTLPDYFEALNQDFRYQLTVIGQFAQAIVAGEINNNQFTIKTDQPNVKVSWQVTGIRKDSVANTHRLVVEEDKPADERGTYLHPGAYGKSETQSVEYARGKRLKGP